MGRGVEKLMEIVGSTADKVRLCPFAEQANGAKSPWIEEPGGLPNKNRAEMLTW